MNIGELIPELEAHLPEVTDAFYEVALRNAARDFCRRTGIYIEEVTVNVVAGITEYEAAVPSDTSIHKLLSAVIDCDYELDPIGFAETRQNQSYNSMPTGIYRNGLKIHLSPVPCATHTLLLNLALIPSATATDIDSNFMDNYGEFIVQGALAYLYDMPKKEWTDVAMAQIHRMPFEAAITEAKREALGYLDSRGTNVRLNGRKRDDY